MNSNQNMIAELARMQYDGETPEPYVMDPQFAVAFLSGLIKDARVALVAAKVEAAPVADLYHARALLKDIETNTVNGVRSESANRAADALACDNTADSDGDRLLDFIDALQDISGYQVNYKRCRSARLAQEFLHTTGVTV